MPEGPKTGPFDGYDYGPQGYSDGGGLQQFLSVKQRDGRSWRWLIRKHADVLDNGEEHARGAADREKHFANDRHDTAPINQRPKQRNEINGSLQWLLWAKPINPMAAFLITEAP
jgi:hypothetical protein